MVIVMAMDSGKIIEGEDPRPYDEEVLNAGWTDVPRVELRLQEVAAPHHEPAEQDAEAFLARLYAAEGLKGRK